MLLVDVERVGASRPGRPLFADLSFTVSSGERMGVVGLNGCGKSTLLRFAVGAEQPESGVVRRGREVRIGVLDQQAALPAGTVAQAVGEGWEAAAVLERLGMGGLVDRDVRTLSGGQQKRVALARALLSVTGSDAPHGRASDLLVLDEPTNHLDVDAIRWLEDRLARFQGGLLLVTHDRHLLDRVATTVLELDRGKGYVHAGYAAYLEGRAEREEQAATAERTRRNLARSELAWLRRGAPARSRKPKARIGAATALVEGRPQAAARAQPLDLALGSTRLGSKVMELHGVGIQVGGVRWLVRGLDLMLEPGDRLGIVGPNGAGKTSLLDVLAGRAEPAEGRVERGTTVRVGYHDQLGVELDLGQRVRDAVAGPTREPSYEDARLLERFWFDRDAQWAEIGTLSGGERRRLQLLLVLARQPNVLLLDEPTNDLDLDTLRALEDFLEGWSGALVVVSHDRAFLERAVDELLAVEGDGRAAMVPGGYGGWVERRDAPVPQMAAARSTRSAAPRRAEPRTARTPGTLRKLLKDTERDLAARERARDRAAEALAGAAGHEELARLGRALADADAALGEAEERWLELAGEAEA